MRQPDSIVNSHWIDVWFSVYWFENSLFSKVDSCVYAYSSGNNILLGILRTITFLEIKDFFSCPPRSESNSVTACLIEWQPHKWKCVLSLRPTRAIHKNNTRSTQRKLKSALNSLHWPLGYSSYNMICMNNFCCEVTS